MITILGLFYFMFGTIVGSFLNVVTLRYNTGRSITRGRSCCFSCGEKLLSRDLIPLVSFLALSGRCRSCKSALSLQYPAVELLTGLLFFGVFLKFSHILDTSFFHYLLPTSYYLIIISLLVAILVYDLRHKIIPNAFVYPFILLSFLNVFGILNFDYLDLFGNWDLGFGISVAAEQAMAGPLLALPFVALWFFSRGRWMGLGDGKLALGIGWLLGLAKGFSAILIAFWIGALVGVFLIGISALLARRSYTLSPLFGMPKYLTIKSEIPFAPFLIFGFLLVYFFNVNILEFLI